MSDLQACGWCNAVYYHPHGQEQCYVCGNDSFIEVKHE